MKKKKQLMAVGATAALVALLAMGTFAWESVSQIAKNEKKEELEPGARLHDDFDGKNKDIYVENYTDEDNGVAVFARIQLYEYLEIGAGAGEPSGTSGKTAQSIVSGSYLDVVNSWYLHNPYDMTEPFHDYIEWEEGGSTTYMPTFNKKQSDLTADINGTMAGPTQGDHIGEAYADYVDYTEVTEVTAEELYDNETIPDVQHESKETLGAEVMTMAEWKDAGGEAGEFWVYDTDGWAYWAAPIEPNTATGCLLNGIERKPLIAEDYYYGINVVCQAVTAGEWGTTEDGTGYFSEGEEATNEALYLLAIAAGETKKVEITFADEFDEISAGESAQFSARLMLGGSVLDDEPMTWSLSGAKSDDTTIDPDTGAITIGADETAAKIIVRAELAEDSSVYSLYTLNINVAKEAYVKIAKDTEYERTSRYVFLGQSAQFNAEVYVNGQKVDGANVLWEVSGNAKSGTKISQFGQLTVDENETSGSVLTLTATYDQDGSVLGTYKVKILSELEHIKYVAPGSTETVFVDNYKWYVLAKSGENYLIWSKDTIGEQVYFHDGNRQNEALRWNNCRIRTSVVASISLPTLRPKTEPYRVYTRNESSSSSEWYETTDNFFILSEADVNGKWSTVGLETAEFKDYTYNGQVLLTEAIKKDLKGGQDSWLRSPGNRIQWPTYMTMNADEPNYGTAYGDEKHNVRVACWVNPDK